MVYETGAQGAWLHLRLEGFGGGEGLNGAQSDIGNGSSLDLTGRNDSVCCFIATSMFWANLGPLASVTTAMQPLVVLQIDKLPQKIEFCEVPEHFLISKI
jgi:hypothetical protein